MCSITAPRAGFSDFIVTTIFLPRPATFFSAQNTKGNAFERPPRVLPFGLFRPLLFLRGLLGGLLGFLRWLLGCFLGCHFPILPFRWVASILQLETAVEECIESRDIDVKKKTTSK
jgi:hypothetical protein